VKSKKGLPVARWFIPFLLLACILAILGSTTGHAERDSNEPDQVFNLTGHVYFSKGPPFYLNGSPAANVTVEMYGTDSGTATTDASGTFHFSIPVRSCFDHAVAVSFKASLADPTCDSHVRPDNGLFLPLFYGCGTIGGDYNAGQMQLAGCTRTAPPVPTPTPRPDDKFVARFTADLPQPTDSLFYAYVPQSAFQRTTVRSGGPIKLPLEVTRAVGELNDDGTLKNIQDLITNGVIAAKSNLVIYAYDVDKAAGERDRILLNGKDIGDHGSPIYLEGSDKAWSKTELKIPTSLIHFAKHTTGQDPVPGKNEIEIRVDETSGTDRWATSVGSASINIDALYPVIMVHGNNSCGNYFAGDYNTPCTGSPRFPEDTWFIKPFIEQGIPFDNSISMRTSTVLQHAIWLRDGDPSQNMRSLRAIAKDWGAKHAHVVAHSKGGLDMRKFLAMIPSGDSETDFAVLTLTTLSSPHLGSVGADYQEDSKTLSRKEILASGASGASILREGIASYLGTDDAKPDLRVSAVRAFNAENIKLLPSYFMVDGEKTQVAYIRFGSDANLDHSSDSNGPTIQVSNLNGDDETRGLPPVNVPSWVPLSAQFTRNYVYTDVYRLFWGVQETTLERKTVLGHTLYRWVREIPYAQPNRENDMAVTVESAQYEPVFAKFGPYSIAKKTADNHATLSNRTTATLVLVSIHASQSTITLSQ
jgi:putative serine esterase DUF676